MPASIPYVRGPAQTPMLRCEKHGTVVPVLQKPGRPMPPVSTICLQCLDESRGLTLERGGTETVESIQRNMPWDGFSPAARRKFEEQRARAEAEGQAVPGSLAEQEALEWIDEERPKAMARERHQRKLRGYRPPAFRDEQFPEYAR